MGIVLCGSRVEIMRSLKEHESPLYGRIDLALDLKPMDYFDSAKFYPAFSPEDKIRLYSVFGGIPFYNRLVDQSRSVRDNIIELVTEPGARLEGEVPSYLSAEISKMTNANEVFGALAQGYSRWGDVLAQSHVSSGPAMADVLDKLISLEIVQKRAPINDPTNKRKSGYFVVDPLSLFYIAMSSATPPRASCSTLRSFMIAMSSKTSRKTTSPICSRKSAVNTSCGRIESARSNRLLTR